ncbi:MAG: T9SS type A sorting domain-containing protein, partial [Bacteroidetes bacterium]
DSLAYVDELIMQWSSGMYFHPYLAERTGRLLLDSNFWNHVDFTDFSVLSGFQPELYETMAIEMDELTVSRTDCGASVAIYKDDEVVLTSIQDYWKGKIGFQQWPIAANIGGTAVYTASGRVEPDWTDRNTSNFNEHLPYIAQQSNVALVMYRPQRVFPILPFVNKDVALHWIEDDFDTVEESGNWLFGERNGNYIAVRRACVGEINGVRACETDGGQTWVFAVGNSNRYGSFSDFQALANNSTFTEEWTTDANGDSTYHASITFEDETIAHSWGPAQPFTSVAETNALQLHLYPNPSDGRFLLDLPNDVLTGTLQIRIMDSMGRNVQFDQVNIGTSVQLDMHSARPGMYTLLLDDGKNRSAARLVKMP